MTVIPAPPFSPTNSVYQIYMPGTLKSSERPCEDRFGTGRYPGGGTRSGTQSTCNFIACRNRVNITQIRGYWQVPGRVTVWQASFSRDAGKKE